LQLKMTLVNVSKRSATLFKVSLAFIFLPWASAGDRGAVPTGDFHTWYKYSR